MAAGEVKVKTIPKPPPHGRLLHITQKLKRDVEEIQLSAAQTLGFHTAGVDGKIPDALTAIIQKGSAMQANIGLLDEVRREMSALYNELRSSKAQLRFKEEAAVSPPPGKRPEKTAEPGQSVTVGSPDAEHLAKERRVEAPDAVIGAGVNP